MRSVLLTLMMVWAGCVAAQNGVGALKAPAKPTPIEVRERSISDLLYYPFTCITAPMTSREGAWEQVTATFGTCESVNMNPGLHAGKSFDFSYQGVTIGLCFFDWYDNRTWYQFYFVTRNEAMDFYNNLVKDVKKAGIPLTKDNVYGGMSNRKRPVSIFKWVSVVEPEKVKEAGPSNIETADVVGMYKVELSVYKRKAQ